jgi:Prolipoprotein diacylglyceryltransferase
LGQRGPRWYGFAYVLAFVSAYFVVRWLSKRGYCDLPPERVSDFITWTALFGVLIGGRIGYVLFYRPEMLRDPLSILRVWEGGMASHGGMIGILALSFLLRAQAQASVDKFGRRPGCGRTARIVLWPVRKFHQWRTLRTADQCFVGDAVPKRTSRKFGRKGARGCGRTEN